MHLKRHTDEPAETLHTFSNANANPVIIYFIHISTSIDSSLCLSLHVLPVIVSQRLHTHFHAQSVPRNWSASGGSSSPLVAHSQGRFPDRNLFRTSTLFICTWIPLISRLLNLLPIMQAASWRGPTSPIGYFTEVQRFMLYKKIIIHFLSLKW